MRTITDHKLNGLNDAIDIHVMDEPGAGGANHFYSLCPQGPEANGLDIHFQKGPIQEAGVNGISGEALIAVVIDRLRSFQAGEFSCNENMHALVHATECLMWLQKRTRDRLARGVEGTSVK